MGRSDTPPPETSFHDLPPAPPHLWNFVTHDELVLCFAVVMASKAEESYRVYPIHDYRTPGTESATDDWTELTLRAMRFLELAHGMKFEGISCKSDGRVTAERPICPGNSLYVALFRAGGFPDMDILLPRAITIAQRRAPSLDTEPMRAISSMIEEEISYRLANTPPDQLQMIAELRAAAMSAARPLLVDAFGLDPQTADDAQRDRTIKDAN